MRASSVVALILAVGPASADVPAAEFLSVTAIPDRGAFYGGYSGIEMSPDGLSAEVVSDRGWLFKLDISRDAAQRVVAVEPTQLHWPIPLGDLEGLAAVDSQLRFVSTEGPAIVSRIDGFRMSCLPIHQDFLDFGSNRALEALAIDTEERLYTLPERPARDADTALSVYRYDNGTWRVIMEIPFDGVYLATGADIGDDGLFYLLERAVTPVGFRSRVRRFDPNNPARAAETLLETAAGRFDNLEGISIWTDKAGITRLTLISDDNFISPQQSQLVEFQLTEPLASGAASD